jgi:hypothetical protein
MLLVVAPLMKKAMEHTSVPEASTIGLNTDLNEAIAALLAHRLHPQNRRVGVGTDHRDGVTRLSWWLAGEHKRRLR